jgi:hypothetical protein
MDVGWVVAGGSKKLFAGDPIGGRGSNGPNGFNCDGSNGIQ